MIAEGANGPTSLEADAIFVERGDPGPPGHPHERRRRHRLVLRVGAGPRPAVLGPRRHPPRLADKMGDAFDRVWELSQSERLPLAAAPRHEHPRGGRRAGRARPLPVIVRDGNALRSGGARCRARRRRRPRSTSPARGTRGPRRGRRAARRGRHAETLVEASSRRAPTPGRRPLGDVAEPATSSRSRPTCPSTRRSTAWPTLDVERLPSPTTAACWACSPESRLARRLAEDEPPAPLEET